SKSHAKLADTSCPMSRRAAASFAWLFDTHISGRSDATTDVGIEEPCEAHLMPHVAEGRGELRMALRYPHQWSHRIAHRRRLKQALQVLQHGRVGLRERSAATAGAANLWRYAIERSQVIQTAI